MFIGRFWHLDVTPHTRSSLGSRRQYMNGVRG
ncbi:hypothetical protein R2601_04268 [Salipiger bermudensis HTCC2601]|uniref:Uncharacterized protein n=1 Tax=Salipiger bermudensis (strain DSM 26914 / JCM 13377 / KCTC 12554 / HTCC2601) TaxID=314265 RepID=Q0FVZ2_SALBH|nr:hypothetical protein R2601_04268 [Salipiger bermudensis HTCC2601]